VRLYVIQRGLQVLLVIFLSLNAVFFMTRLAGDPTLLYVPQNASPAEVAKIRHELGFDRPLYIQYRDFMKRAVRGDFGQSLRYQEPALPLVLQRFPATAELAACAFIFSLLVAIPVGVVGASRRGSVLDAIGVVSTVIGQAVPGFWLGLILIYFLSVKLHLLPTGGYGGFKHFVMPTLTLAAYTTAQFTRLTRSTMIDVLSEDYVRTARSKGVTDRRALYKHALRNAVIPLITIAGLQLGRMLGGVVVIETVFSWPGLGRLIVQALLNRDFTVVLAGVLLTSVTYSIINFIIDLSYGYVDPRIRYG